MSILVVLSGLPGSGKSYLAKNSKLHGQVFRYSTDDYIEQQAILTHSTYTNVFEQHIREATDYMNSELKIAIKNNMTVIWDQTNTRSAKRRWIISQFPEHYAKTCLAIVPPRNDREWQLLVARLFSRQERPIPKYVVDTMFENYEEPTIEEGFDSINIISINGTIIEQLRAIPNLT